MHATDCLSLSVCQGMREKTLRKVRALQLKKRRLKVTAAEHLWTQMTSSSCAPASWKWTGTAQSSTATIATIRKLSYGNCGWDSSLHMRVFHFPPKTYFPSRFWLMRLEAMHFERHKTPLGRTGLVWLSVVLRGKKTRRKRMFSGFWAGFNISTKS